MSSVCKCTPTAPVRGPWPSFGSACLSSLRDPQLPLLHSPAPLMLGKGEVMGKMGVFVPSAALCCLAVALQALLDCEAGCIVVRPRCPLESVCVPGCIRTRILSCVNRTRVFGEVSRSWKVMQGRLPSFLSWDRGENVPGMSPPFITCGGRVRSLLGTLKRQKNQRCRTEIVMAMLNTG